MILYESIFRCCRPWCEEEWWFSLTPSRKEKLRGDTSLANMKVTLRVASVRASPIIGWTIPRRTCDNSLRPFGRCGRRSLAEWRFVPGWGRPERAATGGRVWVRQELFGLCPRSDERAWPEVRRALASRVEPTEYPEHVLPCA